MATNKTAAITRTSGPKPMSCIARAPGIPRPTNIATLRITPAILSLIAELEAGFGGMAPAK
jgi:hypothetical protein